MNAIEVTEEIFAERRKKWEAPPLEATSGTLYKYIKLVGSASQGCITDL